TASIPLHWREVERAAKSGKAEQLRFEIPAAIKRVEREGDLFAPVLSLKQKLPEVGELDAG
ncbi:MAG: ATP-dependent DNA ligase, partial [Solirubrobacterales bacterium]